MKELIVSMSLISYTLSLAELKSITQLPNSNYQKDLEINGITEWSIYSTSEPDSSIAEHTRSLAENLFPYKQSILENITKNDISRYLSIAIISDDVYSAVVIPQETIDLLATYYPGLKFAQLYLHRVVEPE